MSTEVIERRLPATIAALDESAVLISVERNDTVTVSEVERALCDVLDLDQIADILDRDVDAAGIVQTLADYNFARLRPEKPRRDKV